jgi:hypothetical protein
MDGGAFVEPEELLKQLITSRNLYDINPITLNLQGDGRQLGKAHRSVTFCFTILDEGKDVTKAKHLYEVACISAEEDNKALKVTLKPLLDRFHQLKQNGITDYSGEHHTVDCFLSSDWKFMITLLGLCPARSNGCFCIWCLCDRQGRSERDTDKKKAAQWEIDEDRMNVPIGTSGRTAGKENLIPWIPPSHIILDLLHLLLRVMDVLIAHLIADLYTHLAIQKASVQEKFTAACKDIGIKFAFWEPKQKNGKGLPNVFACC